jgi:hypothetical protein
MLAPVSDFPPTLLDQLGHMRSLQSLMQSFEPEACEWSSELAFTSTYDDGRRLE